VTRRFLFIGVTTAQSSMARIFPVWREILGLGTDVDLVGVDLPIHAAPERYREVVRAIAGDPHTVGALVTTHKLDLVAAAADLFGEFDRYAAICREVSAIAKHGGTLLGAATDPIAAGRALHAVLPPRPFARGNGEVLCLGAGGAGTAIALCLLSLRPANDRPAVVRVVDVDGSRLDGLMRVATDVGFAASVEAVRTTSARENDALVAALPPESLVINATGMGKDRPGSPLSDTVEFPQRGIAWELNYRGDLTFLRQALAQQSRRALRVEDGWRYFINGWSTVIEAVFDRPIGEAEIDRLTEAAAFARPPSVTTQGR
jgi:shikimate 5-dehydrogenase